VRPRAARHPLHAPLRMYTKGDPDVLVDRVYGVTSLELG
jgi:hypothetical protein